MKVQKLIQGAKKIFSVGKDEAFLLRAAAWVAVVVSLVILCCELLRSAAPDSEAALRQQEVSQQPASARLNSEEGGKCFASTNWENLPWDNPEEESETEGHYTQSMKFAEEKTSRLAHMLVGVFVGEVAEDASVPEGLLPHQESESALEEENESVPSEAGAVPDSKS